MFVSKKDYGQFASMGESNQTDGKTSIQNLYFNCNGQQNPQVGGSSTNAQGMQDQKNLQQQYTTTNTNQAHNNISSTAAATAAAKPGAFSFRFKIKDNQYHLHPNNQQRYRYSRQYLQSLDSDATNIEAKEMYKLKQKQNYYNSNINSKNNPNKNNNNELNYCSKYNLMVKKYEQNIDLDKQTKQQTTNKHYNYKTNLKKSKNTLQKSKYFSQNPDKDYTKTTIIAHTKNNTGTETETNTNSSSDKTDGIGGNGNGTWGLFPTDTQNFYFDKPGYTQMFQTWNSEQNLARIAPRNK